MPSVKYKPILKSSTRTTNLKKYLNIEFGKKLVFDPHYLGPICFLIFLLEAVLNVYIIEKIKYTEIDWNAYMQEVEGFLNGTWDYQYLKGDTGPLVYPAGFVYLYTAFYYVTNQGRNIYMAQYIFLVLYLLQTLLIHRIYRITAKIPPYALVLATLTSYRIHSIFVLRLFNDPIAVLLFYIQLQEEKHKKMLTKKKMNGQLSKKEKVYLDTRENQMKLNSQGSNGKDFTIVCLAILYYKSYRHNLCSFIALSILQLVLS
ncbi:hypothetical protein GWI33_005995 [Rhynchophorus ferrugineus]|uniref:dolichyl-P-Man:Man5GlcNAc2-PP-dolichol alpha-1,3-mannosyltransferase n=1 Tax=Rhynchophorus ferrugineus TaxID=354439 RepID=A0A834IYB4_RHYFE|nr:hypothetical protein GWI33_005995 [Rhynchophorus ferrugineus]